MFIHAEVIAAFADVGQSLENLNCTIAACNAFKASDPRTFATVDHKLSFVLTDIALGKNLPDGGRGVDEQLEWLYQSAFLEDEEKDYCRTLERLMRQVHEGAIGGPDDRQLHTRYLRLKRIFTEHHGDTRYFD